MRLDGRKVLITGAGSGIGRALAVEAARRGAIIVLSGRNEAALRETAALTGRPADTHLLPLDLADQSARQEIAVRVQELIGGLDVLVNNAGVVEAGPVQDIDDDSLRHLFEIDLLAPISLTRCLLPLLRQAKAGQVINVGSMFGDIAFPFFAAYSAAKFGLRGWSDALRREVDSAGIRVTYCAPRGTRTPAVQSFSAYVAPFAMRLDEPEQVARRIADAIESGARDLYPAGPERLFLWVQKLFPGAIDGGLRKKAARAAGVSSVRLPSGSASILP